jgi:uncharacterized damage-inducible protein DinB
MGAIDNILLMASYNEWMNAKLYEAAATLPAHELAADRKAFFRSILGTLNHIVVADTAWLKRFATHPAHYASLEYVRNLPAPTSLDQIVAADFDELRAHRAMLDAAIKGWTAEIREEDLRHILHYRNFKGVAGQRRFGSLVQHFFNHQTHHRGQVSTLLFQAGVDVGVTDLLALIPDEGTA